ncbi:MAG: hypothetical protein NPIRA04_03290 [Nitrospirales bacterium]|nr:MAG: hypothetical protein NPIRA04_03290 [Nitrospirales bacterium]
MSKCSKNHAKTNRPSTPSVTFYKLKLVRDEGFGMCQERAPNVVSGLLTQCEGPSISDSAVLHGLIRNVFHELDREHFVIVGLDAKHRIIGGSLIAIGSLTAAIVHPREIFKTAIAMNAAALILLHNHPSGDPTPSPEDHELTKRLAECGELLGIRILDHLIVGDNRYYSFADEGVLS